MAPLTPAADDGAVTAAVSEGDGHLADPLLAVGPGAIKQESGAEGKYWVEAGEAERRAVTECGGEDGRRLLFRTYKLRGAILHPYRYTCAAKPTLFVSMHWRVCKKHCMHVLLEECVHTYIPNTNSIGSNC
jgi:hypothetical protein